MHRFNIATLHTAAIHAPTRPELPTAFAAEELQRYLQAMSEVKIPIVPAALPDGHTLAVGGYATSARVPALDTPDSFAISPEAERVTLTAGSPRALLTAVYALLEQLGCRWALDPAQELVPRLSATSIELTPVRRTPYFSVRGYCSDIMTWHYTQPEYLSEHLKEDRTFIDWMGKSGANTFFFIRHPFDTQLTIPELLPEFHRRGIGVEYGGHVIPLLLPREVYREHPDYFPQAADGNRTDHGNLCTSSAGALATASANAVQYVREHPEMGVVHVWGADLWHGGWCACAECGAVSVQDQSLRVCNAVARGLAEAGVARPVCYLAYHDTIEPALTLRPADNVVVEFAPRERCYGHALNHPECTTNRRYAAALERYVELFEGRARLFEYYGDAILFGGCAVPLMQVIDADLDYYQGLGIREITMLQFGAFSWWAYPLNFVTLAAKLAGCASDGAIEDWCAGFGTDAAAARAVFAELQATMQRVVTYGDIRRPPHSAEGARRVLACVESALPELADVSRRLETCGHRALAAQAGLIHYTRGVLEGVRQELQQNLAGRPRHAETHYAAAVQIMEKVEPHLKGVWGSVDLPIIHSFYNVASDAP